MVRSVFPEIVIGASRVMLATMFSVVKLAILLASIEKFATSKYVCSGGEVGPGDGRAVGRADGKLDTVGCSVGMGIGTGLGAADVGMGVGTGLGTTDGRCVAVGIKDVVG